MRDDLEGAGPFTIIAIVLRAPFDIYAERQQKWRLLDEVDRNLRRVGHGFALVVFTVVAAFFFYGARGVGRFLIALVTDGKALPGALFVGLIAYGLVRFVIGAHRLSGMRDAPRASQALVRLALSFGLFVYLWRTWPWAHITTSVLGYWSVWVVGALALWHALDALPRVVVLTGFASSALKAVSKQIRRDQTIMHPVGSYRWWKFWR